MAADLIEFVPIVSSIALLIRLSNDPKFQTSIGIGAETHDWNKFMPYESLAKRRMELTEGTVEQETPERMQNARHFFNLAYPDIDSRDRASLLQMQQDATLASHMAVINYPRENTMPSRVTPQAVVQLYNDNRGYQAVRLNLGDKPGERIVLSSINLD